MAPNWTILKAMATGMFIIEIIPLVHIPRNQVQVLSYFHGEML
jgi:hypothetical protein